jgi:hypothetical protein
MGFPIGPDRARPDVPRVRRNLICPDPPRLYDVPPVLPEENAMRVTVRHVLGSLSIGFILLPVSGFGQTTDSHAPPNTEHTKRIDGTVARVDGNEFLLKAKGGTTETYQLSPVVKVVRSHAGQISDLSKGRYVECTNLYGDSAKVVAGDCRIFPEGMHGFGTDRQDAGSAPSPEVGGTISDVRDDAGTPQGGGKRVMLQIAGDGGSTTMPVTQVTIISVLSAGDASALKAGVHVRGLSQQAADGTGVIQWLTVLDR